MPTLERRREPRIPVQLPLRFTFAGKTVETQITDLSNCGIRFHTPQPLPVMSRMQLSLGLPGGAAGGADRPISIIGVVVRCEEVRGRRSFPFDAAIFFEEVSPASARARLQRFVSEHVAPA